MNEDAIKSLEIGLRGTLDTVMVRRCAQALDFLAAEIKKAFYAQAAHKSNTTVQILSEVKKGQHFIEGLIGSNISWFGNIEYGERGTLGGPPGGGGAPYKREKAPKIKNIYQWIKASSIFTQIKSDAQEYFKKLAKKHEEIGQRPKSKRPKKFDPTKPWWSDDPEMLFAFAIIMKRKRYGIAGLHIIEKTALALAGKIKKYIEEGG